MKNLIYTKDLDKNSVLGLFQKADFYHEIASSKGMTKDCDGKILAALFYEPSTRTRMSTEIAMLRLGGNVINAVGEENSSLKKGETLYDTARVISQYADIIGIRHSAAHSAEDFAKGSSVPVINCGDGPNDHPTQALLEAYTLYKHYGHLDGLKVAYVGDLKTSRTSHALMTLLSNFGGVARLVAPESLKMMDEHRAAGLTYEEYDDLATAVKDVDMIYSARIRKEYFADQTEYERLKMTYILDRAFLEKNAPNAIVQDPLPRVEQIAVDVDDWVGAKYFTAITNGVAIRMALITELLCK